MNLDAKSIYNALQDEESRAIFRSRLLYSITGDNQYIGEVVLKSRCNRPADKIRNIYRKNLMQFIDNVRNEIANYANIASDRFKFALCGMGYYSQIFLQICNINKENLIFLTMMRRRGIVTIF